MLESDTVDTSTSTYIDYYDDSDEQNNGIIDFTELWPTLVFLYDLILSVMSVPSMACSIIHLYKFFRSTSPQNLASKNLTVYCFILLVNNIFNALETWSFLQKLYLLADEMIMVYIHLFYISATTFYKSIIAVELCLCFRKIALYLQNPSSSSQNTKFLICCILGLCGPLLQVVIAEFSENIMISTFRFLAIVRLTRLVPILGAFWYLRSASIDKNELWTKFSLHMRLLFMIGGISAIFGMVEIVSIFILGTSPRDRFQIGTVSLYMHNVGAVLEGIVIGILFTFKKSTFKSVHE